MYYTTLNKIRVHNLYCNGWNKLLQHLDKTDPAAVLRLVGMVRWLADEMDSNCLCSPDAAIKSAYQATGNT